MRLYIQDCLFGTEIVRFHPVLNSKKGVSVYSHSWTRKPFKVGDVRLVRSELIHIHPLESGSVAYGAFSHTRKTNSKLDLTIRFPLDFVGWYDCHAGGVCHTGMGLIQSLFYLLEPPSQALPVGELAFPKAFQRQNHCCMEDWDFWYSWWRLLCCGAFKKLPQDLESLTD